MKTPSLLLLAALAAVPAFADPAPAPRCDAAWLDAALAAVGTPGGMPSDPDKRTVVEGSALKLKFGHEKLCDASAWRYLAVPAAGGKSLTWGDAGFQEAWEKKTIVDQIHLLQAVNDLYGNVDALGRAAIDKADAALAPAEKLGIIARKDEKALKAGETGAAFAGDKSWRAEAAAPAQAFKAADLAADLKQIVVDVPVKGKEPVQTIGPAVLAFRKAVIALASEAAVRGSKRDFADKRQLPASVKADFAQGGAAWAVPAAADDATAAKEDVYRGALGYLTNDKLALSRLDQGLRALLAQRAAAVDAAYASALKQLDGHSVRAAIAAAERVEKGGPDLQKTKLGLDVTKALGDYKDYRDLDALYENKKAQAGWMESDEGKAVSSRLEAMRKDAAAAAPSADGKAVQFTLDGKPFTAGNIRVADLDKDQAYRKFVADNIAQMIATSPLDAKVMAALAAFRGEGDAGQPLSTATPDQAATAGKVLPPAETPPAKPKTAWDTLADNTSSGFLGLGAVFGGSTVSRYGEQINSRLTEAADRDGTTRDEFERRKNFRWSAVNDEYKTRADAIRAKPRDPDLSDAARKTIVDKELASLDDDRKKALDAASDKLKQELGYRDQKATEDWAAAERKKADALIADALKAGVEGSVDQLHGDYKVPGSKRRKSAEKDSGYTGDFYRVERVDTYFNDHWQGDKREKAVLQCRDSLGWKDGVQGKGASDPSQDNVDKMCGVHKGLVDYLDSWRGKVDVNAPAAAPEKK